MVSLADLLPTFMEAAGGDPPENIDGRSFLSVLAGDAKEHRNVVFGTHTGNDNGGPGIANHCPARTVRSATHRYAVNLAPKTLFTTHITGCKTGPHYLPHWDSWVELARTNEKAAKIVQAYQHRPREELFDIENDPYEMINLADNPTYEFQKRTLRRQLAEWCKEQGDAVGLDALRALEAPICRVKEDYVAPFPVREGTYHAFQSEISNRNARLHSRSRVVARHF